MNITNAIINELFVDGQWEGFHDVVVDIFSAEEEISMEILKALFQQLPEHIQHIALEWGLSDTVFRDEAYAYIVSQLNETHVTLETIEGRPSWVR